MNRIVSKLRHYRSALGWKGVFAFCFAKLLLKKSLFSVSVPNIKHPVFVRLATTDTSVLKQVLIEKHYDFRLTFTPRTILDAGANIGLSAVFFANRFPNSVILAVEPEYSNYQLLLKNVGAYPNIKPVHAALWHSEGSISLSDPGLGNHGFQTTDVQPKADADANLVKATTVEALMLEAGWKTVDLLKLDIEGSEKEVLDSCSRWIGHVHAIMAELHDDLRPGCSESFAVASGGFTDGGRCGESLFVFRDRSEQLTDARGNAASP